MLVGNLWSQVRARWIPGGRNPSLVTLQHVMPADADLVAVQAALDRVGEQLAVQFELQDRGGEIVLIDADLASRMSPSALLAFTGSRPLVTLADPRRGDMPLAAAASLAYWRQRELLVQLREIALVRRRARPGAARAGGPASQGSPSQAFDPGFDSQLHGMELLPADIDASRHAFVLRVLQGLRSAAAPMLSASYGPGAHLRMDFLERTVRIDAPALQQLRVQRELPLVVAVATPGAEAQVRDLDEVVWDLGLACGPYALVGQPEDWWHTPLAWTGAAAIERFTRVPRHLEMARLLREAPLSPSELRRRARVSVIDVRRFLQAALMHQMLRWQGASAQD